MHTHLKVVINNCAVICFFGIHFSSVCDSILMDISSIMDKHKLAVFVSSSFRDDYWATRTVYFYSMLFLTPLASKPIYRRDTNELNKHAQWNRGYNIIVTAMLYMIPGVMVRVLHSSALVIDFNHQEPIKKRPRCLQDSFIKIGYLPIKI
jgi:hypothetical protein